MVDVTIIIPTFNRPGYLNRILGYYAEAGGKGFRVIVADSSSDENKARNRDIISRFQNMDLIYLGDYPSVANAYPKFSDALNYVNTEYCVFCADDDFVTPTGIREAVGFLKENPDFAVAQGKFFAFFTEAESTKVCCVPTYSRESISFSDAGDRLKHHLSSYSQPTIYAVHRTETMKRVYQQAVDSKVDLILFGELLLSMLTIVQGKLKCLNVLYAARDGSSTPTGRYLPTLRTAMEAGTYDGKYAKFRNCLANQLSQRSRLNKHQSERVVDNAMTAYLKRYYPPRPSIRLRTVIMMRKILGQHEIT